MRVVFVENEDSFTWNVIDRLPVERAELLVLSGRARGDVRAALAGATHLVIGPGPMDPIRAGLVELVQEAAHRAVPTLGVCLGHQAIGLAFGARLARTRPMHGMRSTAVLQPSRLLPGLSGPFEVMRYHSLSLDRVMSPLRVLARAEDEVIMAVEHASLPMLGLQFHADSYATPRGEELLRAFFRGVA
jgi:anthranilate synthase component 2